MPVYQHCELFDLLAGDLIGSAINKVIPRSPGPAQFLGS